MEEWVHIQEWVSDNSATNWAFSASPRNLVLLSGGALTGTLVYLSVRWAQHPFDLVLRNVIGIYLAVY